MTSTLASKFIINKLLAQKTPTNFPTMFRSAFLSALCLAIMSAPAASIGLPEDNNMENDYLVELDAQPIDKNKINPHKEGHTGKETKKVSEVVKVSNASNDKK